MLTCLCYLCKEMSLVQYFWFLVLSSSFSVYGLTLEYLEEHSLASVGLKAVVPDKDVRSLVDESYDQYK